MELNHKIYELSVRANLDGQEKSIEVIKNGERTPVKLHHLFKKVWFETGRIIGWSLLEHYAVKDGFLVDKEGNQIHFSSERFPEIKVVKIKNPLIIFDEVEVNWEYIRDISTLLGIENVEDTIKGLSPEEKNALVEHRQAKLAEIEAQKREAEAEEARKKAEEEERLAEEARQAEEEAKTAAEKKKLEEETRLAEEAAAKAEAEKIKAEKEAEEARIEQEKAEALAKKAEEEARIAEEKKKQELEQYMLSPAEYEKTKRKYERMGMKEYSSGEYRFFYGTNLPPKESPFIICKRQDGRYEELPGGIVSENEEEVEFEFTDGDKEKTLFLTLDDEDVVIK